MGNHVDHPGSYIRAQVIPVGMNVTNAAKLLGVGRPALSNLLNGNSSLSKKMAVRLEKAFGTPKEELLELQSKYDHQDAEALSENVIVSAYVPAFIPIRAIELESWAGELDSRATLAVLIRRLVNTTTANLEKSNFPGYDNSQKPGWDGETETDKATPWVPTGKTGWEFGTNEDPAKKANGDYRARTDSIPQAERADITFIFVTPRQWDKGEEWAKNRRAKKQWKDVRVLDASNLEQWIECSASVQCWFAEQIRRSHTGLSSLDEQWRKWSGVTEPILSKSLFRGQMEAFSKGLLDWLETDPNEPFVIAANSTDEANAFLHATLSEAQSDNVIVVSNAEGVAGIAKVNQGFTLVVSSTEAEMELADLHRRQHVIISKTNYSSQVEPNVTLGSIDHDTFKAGLTDMKLSSDKIGELERDTGRSLTVLRRRLSKIPEIKTPPWSSEPKAVKKLIPILLAGGWNAQIESDQEILKCLCRHDDYDVIESDIRSLMKQEQSPVWSIGQHRGVSSKLDAFYAVADSILESHIDDFLLMAGIVLSEDDPSYDLSADKRWAANLYGKSRNHSNVIRESICQTLVFLSVHGKDLFRSRFGSGMDYKISKIVKDILTPTSGAKWFSQRSNLPTYAEAAPKTFMDILDKDLRSDAVKVHSLFEPAESGPFGDCLRSGLLWALETIAWAPANFKRSADLLAKLSTIQIDDNWGNKPTSSLLSIFRAWMPQTGATLDQRKSALSSILADYPDIGLMLSFDQFDPGSTIGHYNSKPKWRMDAFGHGEPNSDGERYEFARYAFDLVMTLDLQNLGTLSKLIRGLEALEAGDRQDIWKLVDAWIESNPCDEDKASLREVVRISALSRRGRSRNLEQVDFENAKKTYELLEPADLVQRHLWLFEKDWIDETMDELHEETDWDQRAKRINDQRTIALKEIFDELELDGIVELMIKGETSHLIGRIIGQSEIFDNLLETMERLIEKSVPASATKINQCLTGIFSAIDPKAEEILKQSILKGTSGENLYYRQFLLSAPFRNSTWDIVATLSKPDQSFYWKEVSPFYYRQEDQDVDIIVDKLIEAHRSDVAFHVLSHSWKEVDSKRIVEILENFGQGSKTTGDTKRVESHYVSDALKTIDERGDIGPSVLAQLEFLFIGVLDHTEHGIKNLEKQLCTDPSLFAYMVAMAFKRHDDGEDPEGWKVNDLTQRENLATAAYSLLQRSASVPGRKDDGDISEEDLIAWINSAREQCSEISRSVMGDQTIGKILSSCVTSSDLMPPDGKICKAIQDIGSEEMARGFSIGVMNSRGATWRGEGGDQERVLVEKYRDWAEQLITEYPFMAKIFEEVARHYEHDAEWHDNRALVRGRMETS